MFLHSSLTVIDAIVTRLLETCGPIAVMAGHFALVHHRKTGLLVSGVAEDIDDEETRKLVEGHPYMGNFPLETWRAGIQTVQRLHAAGRDAKLLVLVNDWQHVQPAKSGQRSAERDAYFAGAVIPPALHRALVEAGLDDDVLLSDVRDGVPCILWSESRLRGRYARRLRHRVPVESACAQEWVPVLVRLESLGYGSVAAFVPGTCHVPIVGGTERATERLELAISCTVVSPMGDARDIWATTLIAP